MFNDFYALTSFYILVPQSEHFFLFLLGLLIEEMVCPKQFVDTKVTIDGSVKNHEFFTCKSVNEWTFQHFLSWLKQDSSQIRSHLREYRSSLNSLNKMETLPRDLKSYIGSLKNREV